MERLTKDNYQDDLFELQKTKKVKVDEYTEIGYTQYNYNNDLWNKVKEREDFEEYFGVDLVILFKAKKNGIWVKDKNYNPIIHKLEPDSINISLRENYFVIQELYFEDLDCVMDITGRKWLSKDYGKTWALTKEELEK